MNKLTRYQMSRLLIGSFIWMLASCTNVTSKQYGRLVDRADKVVVIRKEGDSVVLSTNPVLQNTKNVLKRNVQPESPRKLLADANIALYRGTKELGTLLVSSGNKPYVNFRSDSLNFTFRLTYGIGMLLSEVTAMDSR